MYTIDNLAQAVLHTDAIDPKYLADKSGKDEIKHIIAIALDRVAFLGVIEPVKLDMGNGYYIEINTLKKG
jgi:hypothetical protein